MIKKDDSFVRFASYTNALNNLRLLTGIKTQGGTIITGSDGKHLRLQAVERTASPFLASGNSTSIQLDDGFVSFAGRMYFFPSTTYEGNGPGGVFLKVEVEFELTPEFDGLGDEQPWSCVLKDAAPTLEWRALSEALGVHAELLNPPDTPPTIPPTDYTLTQIPGTVYIPIAIAAGSRAINTIERNLSLFARGSGALDYAQQWGPI